MGSRGPTPKPHGAKRVKFESGAPPCPAWLSPTAKAEYKRVAGMLNAAGALQRVDLAHLVSYSVAFAEFRQLNREIAKEGTTIIGARGGVMLNPRVKARQIVYAQMTQSAGKLGLSPADRERLSKPPVKPDPDDVIERFIRGE